ncbi:unnamed protein product [Ceratitis capitata]|uniref:(Mediterranean fruit fly) hypothetical protein n=1 Tax=Ceratitis capitata TaxID=7213 RepID=A0A811UQS1_CERCA|nr:unnamed protein product [Ceratitis capitata]
MTVDVKNFVSKCEVCRKSKAPNITLRAPMVAHLYAVLCTFGQHMVTHAQDYELLRKLDDFDSSVLEKSDRLKLTRDSIGRNIKAAFEVSAKRYNLRSTKVTGTKGNCMYYLEDVESKRKEYYHLKDIRDSGE